MWPFNTGDCLIEVTAWADLTVNLKMLGEKKILKFNWIQTVVICYRLVIKK